MLFGLRNEQRAAAFDHLQTVLLIAHAFGVIGVVEAKPKPALSGPERLN